MSDFHSKFRRRSRKDRTCPECRVTIWKGQHYVRHVGCTDGDFFEAIQCEACNAFADRYLKSLSIASHLNWDEATYHFGSLIEEVAEHVGFEWGSKASMAERRDAIAASLDDWDREELEFQARERQRRLEAKRRQEIHRASRRIISGMSQAGRAAAPAGTYPRPTEHYPSARGMLATAC